jgi:endoglucanase
MALLCSVSFSRAAVSPQIRVNQVGYQPMEVKRAVLMATNTMSGTFSVVSNGISVFSAAIPASSAGNWTTKFTNTYLLDFSSVTNPGVYAIQVASTVNVTSPPVTIALAPALYRPLLTNALFYYQSSRDGPNVITNVISRKPSHTNDERATVYLPPLYNSSDSLVGTLTNVGGPIDVSGGWFDAGDYIKLVETTSYVEGMMLTAMRDYPNLLSASVDFRAESRFGLDWLLKMWDQTNQALYYAVAIGDGNGNTILGDHDSWRLPEADDALSVTPSSDNYYVKYRPAFRAGTNGAIISPNLAGRMAATFALASQVYRTNDPAFADSCLLRAQTIFGLAATNWTTSKSNLLTAPPYDFYPEDVWKDDIEWGAAELYFATAQTTNLAGLPHTNALFYLTNSAYWASKYEADANIDGLNLYDVGMLAHYELFRAMTQAGVSSGLAVTKATLTNSMNSVLSGASSQAGTDPFGCAQAYNGLYDPVPHVLCFALTANFYKQITGSTNYDAFAQKERDWVFGRNPWGTTFIVGAGSTFPHCMQDQIANLAGHLDGTPPQRYGATVDGPNNSLSGNGAFVDNCDVLSFTNYDGKGALFRDGVAYWMTVEPALDYTVPTILLYAQQMGELTPPVLQSPSFSVSGNVQFNLTGSTGFLYVVQGSMDLVSWMSLQTNATPFSFTDSNAAGFSNRYYRAVFTH